MKKIFLTAVLAASALAASAGAYKVSVPVVKDDYDGAMAYIVNLDNNEKVDSTLVADGAAVFQGSVDKPIVARIIVDGDRYAQFFLEDGDIAFNDELDASGTPLNDKFNELSAGLNELVQQFYAAQTNEEKEAVYSRYEELAHKLMLENIDNPIGYWFFIDQASGMEPDELNAFLGEHPALTEYTRVQRLITLNKNKAATGVGSKYVDFDIRGTKLSDYVGKDGKYLLVDFWASWCGPCKRQIPVIRALYDRYKDTKLNVLGVAVWDEADDTRRAITEHGVVWDCIIDAGSIPTDLYGISGIPCIMLIGPDGTILSRDLQGDELTADVDRILAE